MRIDNAQPQTPVPARDHKVADAAQQFESLLVAQILKEGWRRTDEDPTGAAAMELAQEQFAKAISASGGLGIAKMVEAGLKP